MRGLKVAIGVMTVLIVVGVTVIGLTIVRRLSSPPLPSVAQVLNEPIGTQIIGIAATSEGLAVLLHGGGPDRIVLLDLKSGRSGTLVTLKP